MLQTILLRKRAAEQRVLSFESFKRLKLFAIAHSLIWSLLVILLWFFWHDLNIYLRWTLAAIEALFVPDSASFAFIRQNYGSYVQAIEEKGKSKTR